MRPYFFAILALLVITTASHAESNSPSIVPVPQKMEVTSGQYLLAPNTKIVVDDSSTQTGQYLARRLRASTGYLALLERIGQPIHGPAIRLTTNGAKASLGQEGYELTVGGKEITIVAPTSAGLFYGVQTLLQLFPPQIFASNHVTNVEWKIPYLVHIEDQPRFPWRGFMLDCARHFFSKNEVKRVLDEMAVQKLNVFHWHLTDDQGWRIEIKKYPKLTQIGAWRKQSLITPPVDDDGNHTEDHVHPAWDVAPPTAFGPDGRYGGFYTQDDIREVVAYAASLHITIVPEIEMPGHAIAALASYPEMGCGGGNFTVDANAGVNNGVFCVGDDAVIKFLDDILLEVFPLFPGKYVHVGGDEVSDAAKKATWGQSPACQARMKAEGLKTLDELQGWFTGQMGKFVSAHGKTLIGWSEIADAPLPQNAAIMDWIGGAVHAATNGHDVVMTPTKYCYIDYYQSLDTAAEPPGIGGYMPLDKVYSFEPIPHGLAPEFESRILGGQCNLWTEYIPSLAHVEYMAFPRLCALAEVAWSPKSTHDWNNFNERLQIHEQRLEQMGVNYRRDLSVKIGEWTPAQLSAGSTGTNLEWDVTSQVKAPGQYRITFQYTQGSGLNLKSVALLENGKEVVSDGHSGFAARNPSKPVYVLNLPAFNAGVKYSVRANVAGGKSSGMVTSLFKSLDK